MNDASLFFCFGGWGSWVDFWVGVDLYICTFKTNYFSIDSKWSLPGEVLNFDENFCTGNQTWCIRKKMGYISKGKKQTVPGHKTAWSLGCDSSRFSGNLPASFFLTPKMGLVVDMAWRLVIYCFGLIPQVLRLMAEILHHRIGSLSHYLQGFIYLRWCRISSTNSRNPKSYGIPFLWYELLKRMILQSCFNWLFKIHRFRFLHISAWLCRKTDYCFFLFQRWTNN